MDDDSAAKLAKLLDIDPMTIIAQANAERENDLQKKESWLSFSKDWRARDDSDVRSLPA